MSAFAGVQTVRAGTDELSPEGKMAKRIWSALPATPLPEQELLQAILEVTHANMPREMRGDFAAAKVWARGLWDNGVVQRVQGRYVKTDSFPRDAYGTNVGPGSESFNAQLARQAEQEKERARKADEAARRMAASSPHNPLNQPGYVELRRDLDALHSEVSALRLEMRKAARRRDGESVTARLDELAARKGGNQGRERGSSADAGEEGEDHAQAAAEP
jgi:hypothetical protein